MKKTVLIVILLAASLTLAGCHRLGSGVSESDKLDKGTGDAGAVRRSDSGTRDIGNDSGLGHVGGGNSVYSRNGVKQQEDANSNSNIADILPDDNSVAGDSYNAIREVYIDCDNFYCGDWPDDFAFYSGRSESYPRLDIAVPKDKNNLTPQEVGYVKRLRFIDIIKWLVVSGGVLVIIILMVYRNNKRWFNRLYNKFESLYNDYAGPDGKIDKSDMLKLIKSVFGIKR